MECSHPPCCRVPFLRSACETSACCRSSGRVGMKWFADNRKMVMLVTAFLSFICIILSLVAVVALSTTQDDIMATAWTYGEGDDNLHLYVGLKAIVADNDGDVTTTKWTDAACKQDFCDECKGACDAIEVAAIMSLITSIPTFQTDLQRSTVYGDLNCQKMLAIITGILGFLSTLSSLSTYAGGCYENLPDQLAVGGGHVDMDWRLGPGFACILIATLLKPLNVIAHVLLPTPDEKNRPIDGEYNEMSNKI